MKNARLPSALVRMSMRGRPCVLSSAEIGAIVDELTKRGGFVGLAQKHGLSPADLLATLRHHGYSLRALFDAYVRYPELAASALHAEVWSDGRMYR